MKTIFKIIVTAREYNKAIDIIVREHEGKDTIYSAYIPKVHSDYFTASYAIEYLKDRMDEREKYTRKVVNLYENCTKTQCRDRKRPIYNRRSPWANPTYPKGIRYN